MRRFLTTSLVLLFACSIAGATQNVNSNVNAKTRVKKSVTTNANANAGAKKRGPIFRANQEQIKQAQALLKQRNFYGGEQTGQLDDATRGGLKKYQTAENIKVTGTLNRLTLEKMGIPLTDKQKTM